jgi:hypothetical protein
MKQFIMQYKQTFLSHFLFILFDCSSTLHEWPHIQLFLLKTIRIKSAALTAECFSRLLGIKLEDSEGLIVTLFNDNLSTAFFIVSELRLEDDHECWVMRILKAAVVDCFKVTTLYSSGRTG